MQEHQLIRRDGQQCERPTSGIGKLHFATASIIRHHHGADLPAAQRERRAGDEVVGWSVLGGSHEVVHLDRRVHSSKNIAGSQPWKVLAVPIDPSRQNLGFAGIRFHEKAQNEVPSLAAVPSVQDVVLVRRSLQYRVMKQIAILKCHSKSRSKVARLVPPFSMKWVQGVSLQFVSQVSSNSVW